MPEQFSKRQLLLTCYLFHLHYLEISLLVYTNLLAMVQNIWKQCKLDNYVDYVRTTAENCCLGLLALPLS